MVGRAGGGADGPQLLLGEREQRRGVQQCFGFLIEKRLVGRPAALGDEQQFILVTRLCVDLDLGWQVRPGVLLGEHVERCHLRVAQVALIVGIVDATGERLPVVGPGQDALALMTHDDGGAGVLASWQHPSGCDVGVSQQFERHEPVVLRRLRVVENRAQLHEVGGSQQV